jgi:hypothetical protein
MKKKPRFLTRFFSKGKIRIGRENPIIGTITWILKNEANRKNNPLQYNNLVDAFAVARHSSNNTKPALVKVSDAELNPIFINNQPS